MSENAVPETVRSLNRLKELAISTRDQAFRVREANNRMSGERSQQKEVVDRLEEKKTREPITIAEKLDELEEYMSETIKLLAKENERLEQYV